MKWLTMLGLTKLQDQDILDSDDAFDNPYYDEPFQDPDLDDRMKALGTMQRESDILMGFDNGMLKMRDKINGDASNPHLDVPNGIQETQVAL